MAKLADVNHPQRHLAGGKYATFNLTRFNTLLKLTRAKLSKHSRLKDTMAQAVPVYDSVSVSKSIDQI